ncbi:MAG: hypothetical protein LBS36_05210 [Oscillospiraceae bacterium]|jgi:hypothetical protein|nr:hypothetical protein [Oscillospiraceae bacterium]
MSAVHKVRLMSAAVPMKVHANQYGTVTVLGEGTNDYDVLVNKPRINGVTLVGNKTTEEIGIEEISNMELEDLLNGQI